jgi:hypothetical protein
MIESMGQEMTGLYPMVTVILILIVILIVVGKWLD